MVSRTHSPRRPSPLVCHISFVSCDDEGLPEGNRSTRESCEGSKVPIIHGDFECIFAYFSVREIVATARGSTWVPSVAGCARGWS